MLRAFAEAAAVLGRDDYRRAAEANAEFVLSKLKSGDRLMRTYKDGQAKLNGYLEDYSFFADGMLALYQATLDPRWYREARALAATMVEQFWDPEQGAFFDTGRDHEQLVSRPRDVFDNATPAGNSVAAEVLLRLAEFTGNDGYRERAQRLLAGLRDAMAQHPTAFGHLLCALDFALGPVKEVALAGDPAAGETRALLRVLFGNFLPNTVVALRRPGPEGERAERLIPLLAGRPQLNGKATAYVCEQYTCQLPVTEARALAEQLGVSSGPG
jgi:uncharacterized protein YyaL (SSP411 family)